MERLRRGHAEFWLKPSSGHVGFGQGSRRESELHRRRCASRGRWAASANFRQVILECSQRALVSARWVYGSDTDAVNLALFDFDGTNAAAHCRPCFIRTPSTVSIGTRRKVTLSLSSPLHSLRRIRERYDLSRCATIYAYGDSDEDLEMLSVAHEKYFQWKKIG